MAREISRVRAPDVADRQHPLYSLNPEGWLESLKQGPYEEASSTDASVLPVEPAATEIAGAGTASG